MTQTDDTADSDSDVPYAGLFPDVVIDAVEQAGIACDGRVLALNSYENRVYQVGVEDRRPVVVKFYRPGRWSDAAIEEEHRFAHELVQAEVPVVAPLKIDGRSLMRHAGFRLAIFLAQGGRWPELGQPEERRTIGRFLGRIHMVGASRAFAVRPSMDIDRLGRASRDWLLDSGWIPAHLEVAYESVTDALLDAIADSYDRAGDFLELRIHGDCHRGNILWTDDGPHFVDLDDCVTGPAIQDLWMLLAGDDDEMRAQFSEILEGYRTFADLDLRQLWLVEGLRTLRIMHYAAWIARRWSDPAFPKAFPWFEETRYWEEHVLTLREQAALLQEPPLVL